MKPRRLLRRSLFHLLRQGARLAALGGMAGLQAWGEHFGRWHYRLGGKQRRKLHGQLARVLGSDSAQGIDIEAVLAEAYRVNDRAIFEIMAAYSGAVSPAELAASVVVHGLDILDRARASGQGVIVLGMHSGNGVALAVHLGQHGYPVHVVYRESNKIRPNFFRDGIRRQGLNAIAALPPAAGVRQMLSALKAGEILFILMDQGNKRGGVPVEFLGKELGLPPGPVELARRTGAPIVPVLLHAVDARWHFRLQSPLHMDRSRELEHEVKIIGDLMQQAILANPQWWSWHQRRWWRQPFLADSAARTAPANKASMDDCSEAP